MDTQIKKPNKQKAAYDFIRERITDGTYGPGYRVVIDQIAKELGTSPIPVREAIRQLEADGLIQYKPYSGAIVSIINEKEYLEILSVLAVMEGYATALSSELLSAEDIEEIERVNQSMKEAVAEFDFDKFGSLNRKFHSLIYQKCGNRFLIENVTQTWQHMDRIRRSGFSFVPKRVHQSIQEHEHIIRLIKEKAPLHVIEAFVREHKLNTARAFQKRQEEG